jgi:hypothetical protein
MRSACGYCGTESMKEADNPNGIHTALPVADIPRGAMMDAVPGVWQSPTKAA